MHCVKKLAKCAIALAVIIVLASTVQTSSLQVSSQDQPFYSSNQELNRWWNSMNPEAQALLLGLVASGTAAVGGGIVYPVSDVSMSVQELMQGRTLDAIATQILQKSPGSFLTPEESRYLDDLAEQLQLMIPDNI